MFVPESIPGWSVEEGAGDSATGLGAARGDVVESPKPLLEPELPELEPEPLEDEEPVLPVEEPEVG
jgi:hypothetical protein